MIDATVIIGLLILLTFNSVSSPFVETEQSEFFNEWYMVQNELEKIDRTLIRCEAILNPQSIDTSRPGGIVQQGVDPRPSAAGIDNLLEPELTAEEISNENFQKQLGEKCNALRVEKIEQNQKLLVLNDWGVDFSYLETDGEQVFESEYSKELASGPFWVNMINLGMIFPFLVSGIVDSIISLKKNEARKAPLQRPGRREARKSPVQW